MKVYFSEFTNEIKQHAAKEFPKECCGLIINDKYVPCSNVAKDPEKDFKIKPEDIIKSDKEGKIQAIVHSHNDWPHASKKDMIEQINSKVPWGIVNVVKGNPRELVFFGDQLPIQDYVGRPFFHGVYDCYGLVRDYYRKELNITLPQFPRDYGFWKKDSKAFENMLEDGLGSAGFQIVGNDIKDLKQHDGILARINASIMNHCGVYIGEGGLILHHLCLHRISLSMRDPINIYRDHIGYIVRHKEFM